MIEAIIINNNPGASVEYPQYPTLSMLSSHAQAGGKMEVGMKSRNHCKYAGDCDYFMNANFGQRDRKLTCIYYDDGRCRIVNVPADAGEKGRRKVKK